MNNPLLDTARQLVATKGIRIESDVQEQLVQEVAEALEDHINGELLSRLTDEQLDAFDREITDDTTADDTLAFFTRNGVDIQDATKVAMTRFKQAYLGEK